MQKYFFIFHILRKYTQKYNLIWSSCRKHVSADPYLFVCTGSTCSEIEEVLGERYISARKMIGFHSRILTNEIDCTFHGGFSHKGPLRRVVGPLNAYKRRRYVTYTQPALHPSYPQPTQLTCCTLARQRERKEALTCRTAWSGRRNTLRCTRTFRTSAQ